MAEYVYQVKQIQGVPQDIRLDVYGDYGEKTVLFHYAKKSFYPFLIIEWWQPKVAQFQ